jgi:large subunit ribosomal protein L3
MPGHLGVERVTTLNLQIAAVDAEKGLLMVRGAVPGSKGEFVSIRDAIKKTLHADAPMPAGLLQAAAPAEPAAVENSDAS